MDLEVMSRRQGQTGDFLRTDFNHREILDVSHSQRSGHCTFKQCFLSNSPAPCRSTSCLALYSKFQRIEHQCRRWPDVRDRSTIPEHSTIEVCGSRASRHRKLFSHNTHDHEAMQLEIAAIQLHYFYLVIIRFLRNIFRYTGKVWHFSQAALKTLHVRLLMRAMSYYSFVLKYFGKPQRMVELAALTSRPKARF